MSPFLTQRNAYIIGAIAAGWGSVLGMGLIPDGPVSHTISAVTTFAVVFFAALGFNRTPQGNVLPPDTITAIDRQATLAKAGDAVVAAVAQKVTEAAKEPPDAYT